MTTDNQLAPTGAEIDALWALLARAAIASPTKFAREVLARWGAQPTPSSAAEFALQALVAAGHVSQELVDKAMALPGAPQPADSGKSFQTYGETRAYSKGYYAGKKAALAAQPVVREPLTDEQWQRIADLTDSILTRATKDEIERVIGIKGGQHGTDT